MVKLEIVTDFVKQISKALGIPKTVVEDYFEIGEDKEGWFYAKKYARKWLERFALKCQQSWQNITPSERKLSFNIQLLGSENKRGIYQTLSCAFHEILLSPQLFGKKEAYVKEIKKACLERVAHLVRFAVF